MLFIYSGVPRVKSEAMLVFLIPRKVEKHAGLRHVTQRMFFFKAELSLTG